MADEHPDTLLADFAVDALQPEVRRQVERHLAGCARCRARLRSLQTTALLLRNLPLPELPRSFLLPPTTAPRRAPPRRLLPISFLSAAAVLFLALGLSLALGRSSGGLATSSSAAPSSQSVAASAPVRGFGAAGSAAATTAGPPQIAAQAAAQAPRPAVAAARAQQSATPLAATSPTPVASPVPQPESTRPAIQAYQVLLAVGGVGCLLVAVSALVRRAPAIR
ncbi:MAG TPA: zf-HC2 domain-containing protein [Chloroflexota bacterium]